MAQINGEQPFFWTIKDACKFLRISETTLYHMCQTPRKKGGPPMVYVSKTRIRFPREEFIQWALSRSN